MAYYGANTSGGGSDIRPRELVTEAVYLADTDVDYSDFDNDGNGSVDGVYVIYAGYGEEYSGVSTDAIWAHAWGIPTVTLDGKTISRYSCSSELRGNSGTNLCRIGVICHEFGHVLGSPDFYDTNYATGGQYSGTGYWDLMASGSWNNSGATPAHHNAYTKVYVYSWATATTKSAGALITLYNAEENSNSFYRYNTTTANEYFLMENRQQHKFDNNIPGHGMIIYHIDGTYIASAGNLINAGIHQGMYPVCANAAGNPTAVYGTINGTGCPFPGTSSITSFTDVTTPYSLSWALANTDKPITDITEDVGAKTVTITFMGGPVAGLWTGAVSNNWGTAGNWDDLNVPDSDVDVVINAGAANMPEVNESTASPAACNTLTIDEDATLTINEGKALTASGNTTNNGTFTLKSDATGTGGFIDNGTIGGTGTFNVNKYLTGSGGSTPNGSFLVYRISCFFNNKHNL